MLQPGEGPDAGATKLQVVNRTIDVNGKPGPAISILQANGTQPFRVVLEAGMAALVQYQA